MINDLLFVAGSLCIVAGAWIYSDAAALITGGVIVATMGVVGAANERRKTRKEDS